MVLSFVAYQNPFTTIIIAVGTVMVIVEKILF